jgi:energy-coupling factor transporter ATP-binding protein EcfA2
VKESNHERQLEVAATLENCRARIRSNESQLDLAPHWLPAAGLNAQCSEALKLLDNLEQRLERKLVVTLIGPSGAGKSTLLNALAGVDELSTSGFDRPTTRDVAVYCKERNDASPLIDTLGEQTVRILTSSKADSLEHVLLVDTPDTDSEACPEHRPLVEKVIAASDVLLCVFNSENPKRLDNIDFLRPLVDFFPKDSVYAILTHCDRRPEADLREAIRPDFEKHLSRAWSRDSMEVFCVSGRSHLSNPDWPDDAGPLHSFDEFGKVQELLFGQLNRGSVVLDRRIQQAEHLAEYVQNSIAAKAGETIGTAAETRKQIAALQQDALKAAVESMERKGGEELFAMDVMLYQRMAQLSWGPVGWLVAIWSKLLSWGSGALGVLRIGSPVMQAWGAISSAVKHKQTTQAIDQASDSQWVEDALREYRAELNRRWPDIADTLIQAGFSREILAKENISPDLDEFRHRVASAWVHSLTESIEKTAQTLSHSSLQFILNLPFIVIGGKVAYTCIVSFLASNYFGEAYFRHALYCLVLVWILPFILLQLLVKFAGGMRMLARAMKSLFPRLGGVAEDSPIERELAAVESLAG